MGNFQGKFEKRIVLRGLNKVTQRVSGLHPIKMFH